MTPKQRVLKKYPKAYTIRYAPRSVYVYAEPIEAAPRGMEFPARVIGFGGHCQGAWVNAAEEIARMEKSAKKRPNVSLRGDPPALSEERPSPKEGSTP